MGAAGWAFLPAIRGNPAFELAAIAEPVAEMRETVAAETGVAVHPDLPSMLRDAELDAVYIATPTELHPEHVARGLRREKARADREADGDPRRAGAGDGRGGRARRRRAPGRSFAQLRPADRADARDRRVRRARPRPHDPHLELHRLDGAAAPRRRTRRRAGRRRHLSPGRASDRHPAADRRRPGEERARHHLRLGRQPPLDRRAHHLPEFCRRRRRDRGLQRLRPFLRHRVDRRRRRVGRAREAARRAAAVRRADARAGTGGQAQARPQRHSDQRAASAAFRTDHGELRARRHPPVAGRAAGLFRARPRGDRAAERTKARAIW